MRLLIVFQVLVIGLYIECPQFIPSHPTNGVTAFHVSFLSFVCLENIFAYARLFYGCQDSLPRIDTVFRSFGERLCI